MSENALVTNPTGTDPARATAKAKSNIMAGSAIAPVVPASYDDAARFANLIYVSGMYPTSFDERNVKDNDPVVIQAKITTAIFHGLEVGLPPMTAVQSIAVINGRPSIWGDAALAMCFRSGLIANFEEKIAGEGDKRTATCTIKRVNLPTPSVATFSMAEARLAGLTGKGGPWKTYPDRMLAMRARSFALRNLFPDVLKGLALAEEQRDVITSNRRDDTADVVSLADEALGHAEGPAADAIDAEVIEDDGTDAPDDQGEPAQEEASQDEDATEAASDDEESAGDPILNAIKALPLNVDKIDEWTDTNMGALASIDEDEPDRGKTINECLSAKRQLAVTNAERNSAGADKRESGLLND